MKEAAQESFYQTVLRLVEGARHSGRMLTVYVGAKAYIGKPTIIDNELYIQPTSGKTEHVNILDVSFVE